MRKTIKNVPEYLKIANELHLNLALCGSHGRAKTAVIQKYADQEGFKLITLVLARFLPEDMLGLPVVKTVGDEKITAYSNPDWLVEACDPKKKVLLFFDEFNNAELDVQAAILNLIEDRRMGDLTLAETTQIVMAYNPVAIAPNAKVFSKATRDRLCVIPIIDDTSAYTDYYEENGMDGLKRIFTDMPELVRSYDEESIDAAYENAEFTFRSAEKAYKICEYGKAHETNNDIIKDLVCGYGGKVGDSFVDYIIKKYYDSNENDATVLEALKEADTVDKFINKVHNEHLLESYREWPELTRIVRKIEDELDEKDFKKFVDSCLTNEFKKLYELDKIQ